MSPVVVLLLGPTHTHYSTIWPAMEPAHTPSSPNHFKLIKGILQQHEAQFAAVAAAKAR